MSLSRRKIELSFDENVPRIWANGESFTTHWLNAYTILIPDGEKFIIRTCKRFSSQVPEVLRDDVLGLYYQEGQHSVQHKKALVLLLKQGYKINWFNQLCNAVCYQFLEPVFPKISSLSTVSGIEHINSIIAEHFLSDDVFFNTANKNMAKMFAWHFAEEIEHKCVVYDVLNSVSPSRILRLFGLITTFFTFVSFLYIASFIFAFQDRSIFKLRFWRGVYRFNFRDRFLLKLLKGSMLYMKKSFHPSNIKNNHLVGKGISIYQALEK